MPAVEGFLPSNSGFHFPNRFAHVPLRSFAIPLIGGTITLGDAANGLCGGMVYTVADYFAQHQAPPPTTTPPQDGPLYEYLVDRLFESWDIPAGILHYLELMSPELPDFGVGENPLSFLSRSRASIMIQDEWPRIRQDIDAGRLSPLGLIKTKSTDPAQLGQNHQVLAYAYDLEGTNLTLKLYDPNAPDDDDATISLSIARTDEPCHLSCTTAPTVYCFFRSNYTAKGPPPAGMPW